MCACLILAVTLCWIDYQNFLYRTFLIILYEIICIAKIDKIPVFFLIIIHPNRRLPWWHRQTKSSTYSIAWKIKQEWKFFCLMEVFVSFILGTKRLCVYLVNDSITYLFCNMTLEKYLSLFTEVKNHNLEIDVLLHEKCVKYCWCTE